MSAAHSLLELPAPLPTSNELRDYANTLKSLKRMVQDTAEDLAVAPEILGNRRALEELSRDVLVRGKNELTAFFQGWRAGIIGERLLERLLSHDPE